jgi:hypothetical protein
MRNFRTGTLMLLLVIAALIVALVMERERNRSARTDNSSPKHTLDKIFMNLIRKRVSKPDDGGRPVAVGRPESGRGDGR